eukprot:13556-Heterococcus_DN1.PRE.1
MASYLGSLMPRLTALSTAHADGVLDEELFTALRTNVMAVPDLEALLQQLQELHGLVGTVITQDEYITHASIAVREALPQSEEQAQQAQAGRAQQTGAVPATAAETGAADFDAAYQKYDAEISDEDSDGDWSDEQEDEEEED